MAVRTTVCSGPAATATARATPTTRRGSGCHRPPPHRPCPSTLPPPLPLLPLLPLLLLLLLLLLSDGSSATTWLWFPEDPQLKRSPVSDTTHVRFSEHTTATPDAPPRSGSSDSTSRGVVKPPPRLFFSALLVLLVVACGGRPRASAPLPQV